MVPWVYSSGGIGGIGDLKLIIINQLLIFSHVSYLIISDILYCVAHNTDSHVNQVR